MGAPFFTPSSGGITLDEIVEICNCIEVQGNYDKNKTFNSVKALGDAGADDISFLSNAQYAKQLSSSLAYACFIKPDHADKAPDSMVKILCEDPYYSYALFLRHLYPSAAKPQPKDVGVSSAAIVSKSAKIGAGVYIGPFVVIEDNVVIGDNTFIDSHAAIKEGTTIGNNCYIGNNVVISNSRIGSDVILYTGCLIGQPGFGYAPSRKGHLHIPHIGGVIIEDGVEMGAGCAIDRGVLKDTKVGAGTKLDNMVHVAHNVSIGKHCLMAAGVSIAGSTVIGNFVSIGGATKIAPHINITDGATIGAGSGVAHDVTTTAPMIGYPLVSFTQFWKQQAVLNRLTDAKYRNKKE